MHQLNACFWAAALSKLIICEAGNAATAISAFNRIDSWDVSLIIIIMSQMLEVLNVHELPTFTLTFTLPS